MAKDRIKIIHIGKKAPKGWKELAGAIHMGKGIWLMWIERIDKKKESV